MKNPISSSSTIRIHEVAQDELCECLSVLLLDHAKAEVCAMGGNVLKLGIIEESTVLKNWYIAQGFVHTGTKKFDHLPFTSGYLEWRTE